MSSISRRALLVGLAPAALALGGCNAGQVRGAIDAVYTEVVTVAKILEAAAVKVATDLKAAVAMVAPYIPTCCRLIVSMDVLAQTMIANGILSPEPGSRLEAAIASLHRAATASAIASTAQSGASPADPQGLAAWMLQIVALVASATSRKITPTAAIA